MACTGGLLARADEIAGGPFADKQTDGADEDRFAGAGLARQDVQARTELHLKRVDDSQVADAEESDHGIERTPIISDL
jgi:hypothetical protein